MHSLEIVDIWVFLLEGRLSHDRERVERNIGSTHLHPGHSRGDLFVESNTNQTNREKEKVQR